MHVAVTAIGRDRPGIVAAVGKVLFDHGANIEDSRMTILRGHFSMMLVVAVETEPRLLEAELHAATRELGLVVSVRPVDDAAQPAPDGDAYTLAVYGADHPGIVYRFAAALAEADVNITDVTTRIVDGEPPVYVMLIEATVPQALEPAMLEAGLQKLAGSLGVDVSMRPSDADTL